MFKDYNESQQEELLDAEYPQKDCLYLLVSSEKSPCKQFRL